jgi:PEP-CTERM motif
MMSIYKQTSSIAAVTMVLSLGISTSAWSASFQLPTNFNDSLAQQYSTSLYFYSQTGDYVGQGREWFYSPTDGTFSISRNFANGIGFSFNNSTRWSADFAAPFQQTLIPGFYDSATRFPFQASNTPGLNVSGAGRGCNVSGGRFDVLQAQYGSNGAVQSFDAIFSQYCENITAQGTPALYGRVRYNAGNSTGVPEPSSLLGLLGFGSWVLWRQTRLKRRSAFLRSQV